MKVAGSYPMIGSWDDFDGPNKMLVAGPYDVAATPTGPGAGRRLPHQEQPQPSTAVWRAPGPPHAAHPSSRHNGCTRHDRRNSIGSRLPRWIIPVPLTSPPAEEASQEQARAILRGPASLFRT